MSRRVFGRAEEGYRRDKENNYKRYCDSTNPHPTLYLPGKGDAFHQSDMARMNAKTPRERFHIVKAMRGRSPRRPLQLRKSSRVKSTACEIVETGLSVSRKLWECAHVLVSLSSFDDSTFLRHSSFGFRHHPNSSPSPSPLRTRRGDQFASCGTKTRGLIHPPRPSKGRG